MPQLEEASARAEATAPAATVPAEPGRRGRRIPPALVALALGMLHLLFALLVFDPTPHSGGDNAGYITLARSLLEHGAYLDLYDPATPPHTQYPPVFPALLAGFIALGLGSWVSLKLVVVSLSAGAVALSYLWLRRWQPAGWLPVAVAALLALSPGVLNQSHWILSDVPFWVLTMLSLWAWERLAPADRGRFAIAVAATVLAYFTRSAGLPLVVAALGWLALRRRWRMLAVLAAAVVPLALLWWLRARTLGGVDYVEQFWWIDPYQPELGRIGPRELLQRVVANDRMYLRFHLPALLLGLQGPAVFMLSIAIGVLAIFGWTARLRRPGVAELFLPLYVGLLLLWPAVWSGERFLLPVLPLALGYAGLALHALATRVRPWLARPLGALAVLGLLVLVVPALRVDIAHGRACTAAYRAGERFPCLPAGARELFELAVWSEAGLPQDAVVFSRKPRPFYVLSGRQGRTFPMTRDPAPFLAAADSLGARYVVLDRMDQLSELYLSHVLAAQPGAFCIASTTGLAGTTLFGIRPPPERQPPLADAGGDGEVVVEFDSCPADYVSASPSPAR